MGITVFAGRFYEFHRDRVVSRPGQPLVTKGGLVAEAGVTKPSLNRLFGSKDALIAACTQRNVDEGRAALDALVEAAGVNPRAQLVS